MKRKHFVYAAVSIYLAAIGYSMFRGAPPTLETLDDAKAHFEKLGLHCQILNPTVGPNLVISEQPLSEDEAKDFACFIGSSIRNNTGKVLVRYNLECFQPNPQSETNRIWGKLWAAGDPALLDKLR